MDLHKDPEARDRASYPGSRDRVRAGSEARPATGTTRRARRPHSRTLRRAGRDTIRCCASTASSAGYGAKEVLHGIDLRLGAGQSLCLIGPNGAGKSTILHSIFGLADIRGGRIEVGGRNVTRLGPNAKLRDAGIAYVLQDSSLFPDMTVERNLWLGGYLMRPPRRRAGARRSGSSIATRRSRARRNEPARVLRAASAACSRFRARSSCARGCCWSTSLRSASSRRSSTRFSTMLRDLRDRERLSIVMVEQNAKRGLELADIGCVVRRGRDRDGRHRRRAARAIRRSADSSSAVDLREPARSRASARAADQVLQVLDRHGEADAGRLADRGVLRALDEAHVDDADDLARVARRTADCRCGRDTPWRRAGTGRTARP